MSSRRADVVQELLTPADIAAKVALIGEDKIEVRWGGDKVAAVRKNIVGSRMQIPGREVTFREMRC